MVRVRREREVDIRHRRRLEPEEAHALRQVSRDPERAQRRQPERELQRKDAEHVGEEAEVCVALAPRDVRGRRSAAATLALGKVRLSHVGRVLATGVARP